MFAAQEYRTYAETGNKEIFVDGEKIDSNVVPAFADGKTHKIVANI